MLPQKIITYVITHLFLVFSGCIGFKTKKERKY
nr:MAG TPA: hypothetical protein [Caudoviricetes sp.]